MCGIVGLAGNFNKELLDSLLETIIHRGEDYSNSYVSGDNLIGLGHNLLCIFNLVSENYEIFAKLENNKQPIMKDDLVLVFNGEIYNFYRLERFLKENDENYTESKSDSQLLINLTNYFYKKFHNNYRKSLYDNFKNDGSEESKRKAFVDNLLLKSVKEVLRLLDGDYAFAIFDRQYNNLAICRDPIGVKPLYYGANDEINLKAFASEKKALWKAGIDDRNIHDLKPGSILYNWETIDLEDDLINKIIQTDFREIKKQYSNYNDYLKTKDSYENYMELLENDLYSAVHKRVENIRDLGLIFSGGVDSTILAVILKKLSEYREKRIENGELIQPLNIKLYSVGVENSPDIEFSREIADDLGLDLKTIIIDRKTVRDSIKPVLTAIEDDNIMKLGVGMTIYLATKAMKEDGIRVALSGQGADELFGGYNRYLKHFENNQLFDAYFDLDEEIYHDIANMYHVNLERDDAVSMANGVELRVPFLDKYIIDLALDIPGKYKIKDSEDVLRKHILRDVAKSIGVPDYIADRPKKAAQYGSGINKILKKSALRSFDMDEFMYSLKYNR